MLGLTGRRVDRVGEGSREALERSVVGRSVMGVELGEHDRDESGGLTQGSPGR